LLEKILTWLAANDFAVGGATTVLLSGILMTMRGLPSRSWDWILRTFTVSTDILDREPAFHWIREWLSQNHAFSSKRRLSVHVGEGYEQRKRSIVFSPAPGVHWMFYRGNLMRVVRTRSEEPGAYGPVVQESFFIRIFARNPRIIEELLSGSMAMALAPQPGVVDVYIAQHGDWMRARNVSSRDLDSVIVSPDIRSKIVDDLSEFVQSKEWYDQRGIPYRRGYLLHGKAGNGKTSLVRGITEKFKLDLYILDIGDPMLSDLSIQWLMSRLPPLSCLLIEDIDRALSERSSGNRPGKHAKLPDGGKIDLLTKSEEELTLAGLLNGLDGVMSAPGRIMFMTTNHPEKLDRALVRPGRVDVNLEIPDPGPNEIAEFFSRMYEREFMTAQFYGIHNKTMAEVQGACLLNKNNWEKALESLVPEKEGE